MRIEHHWEYKHVSYNVDCGADFVIGQLTALGREQWQLAAIDTGRGIMFLKRGVVDVARDSVNGKVGE